MPTAQEAAAAFKAENPEAAALLVAEGHAAGATAELARIQSVRAQAMPGHEALIDKLAFDGKTTGPEAAVAVVAAERANQTAQAAARAGDATKPVAAAPAPAPVASAPASTSHAGMAVSASRAELHNRALAYQAQHPGTDYVAAVKAVQAMPATE
jgi:capsid assembly protease